MDHEPNYPRDFADKAFRQVLLHPANLEAFLRRALPHLADRFDFTHVEPLPRDFIIADYRERECDLLFRIPFRVTPHQDRTVGICVLVEHQTQADHRMPLRMLQYVVEFWTREQRAWQQDKSPTKGLFRLTPVIPVVLYAATRDWGSSRTIIDLLNEPTILHSFAPDWGPLIWELSSQTIGELMESHAGFDRFLALVRAEHDPLSEFEPLFRAVFSDLYHRTGNEVYLSEMLNLMFAWTTWQRPDSERRVWEEVVHETVNNAEEERRIHAMSKSALETLIERVSAENQEIGQQRGSLNTLRDNVLFLGCERLGEPTPDERNRLESCADYAILRQWLKKTNSATTWAEVFQD